MTRASSLRRLSPLLLLAAALVALAVFLVADGLPPAQAQSDLPKVGFLNTTGVALELDIADADGFDGLRSYELIDVQIESPLTYDSTVKVVIDVANSTATQGEDYRIALTNAPGETTTKLLDLPGGESTVSFRVYYVPDYKDEGEESFKLRMEAIADAPYKLEDSAGYYTGYEVSILDSSYEAPEEADRQRGLETIGSLHTIGTGPGTIYWESTLTLTNVSGGSFGCDSGLGSTAKQCVPAGALTDNTFTYRGVDYSITYAAFDRAQDLLRIDLNTPPPQDLLDNGAMLIDGRKFPFSAGQNDTFFVRTGSADLSLAEGDKVELQLVSADSVFPYQLFLTSRPTADVTVTPFAYNRDRGSTQSLTISPSSRTVSPDNWSDNLVFTVIAPSEAGRHVIFHYPTSDDKNYHYQEWFSGPDVPRGNVYVTVSDGGL